MSQPRSQLPAASAALLTLSVVICLGASAGSGQVGQAGPRGLSEARAVSDDQRQAMAGLLAKVSSRREADRVPAAATAQAWRAGHEAARPAPARVLRPIERGDRPAMTTPLPFHRLNLPPPSA